MVRRIFLLMIPTVLLGLILGRLVASGALGSHGGVIAMVLGSVVLGVLAGLFASPRKPGMPTHAHGAHAHGAVGDRPTSRR
jgi:hypothetical protein